MVTSRSVAALVLTACTACTTLLVSSCDLLSGDIFPSWLPYVEARADLTAAAAEAGIGTLRNLDTVKYIHFIDSADGVDKSKILAYLKGLDGEALVAFEPAGMAASENWARIPGSIPLYHGLGSRIIQTPTGFIAGQLSFSMTELNALPVLVTPGPIPGGIVLAVGTPVQYFVMKTSPPGDPVCWLEIQKYDSTFSSFTSTFRKLDVAGSAMFMADAKFFAGAASTDGTFRLLVESTNGTYVFSFADETAMLSPNPLMDDVTATRTGPIPRGNNGGWLTADGVVTMNRHSETYINLYAYDWNALDTTPTDRLQITGDTEAYQIMSFDASGSWWYLHDQLTHHLYALRTWW